jgi:hypothetical protein
MGFFQVETVGRMFLTRIGVRNTVPSSKARIVPFGLFQAFLRLYSRTRSSVGVIVAHLTPTPYVLTALAASMVT